MTLTDGSKKNLKGCTMTIKVKYITSAYVLGTTDGESYHIYPNRDKCDCGICTYGFPTEKH